MNIAFARLNNLFLVTPDILLVFLIVASGGNLQVQHHRIILEETCNYVFIN